MTTATAIVLAGGAPVLGSLRDALPDPALVVAADSGLVQAAQLDLPVDLLVGDLDSVSPEDVAAARSAGASVEQHPEDKDVTDLELALAAVESRGIDRAVVVGGASLTRTDHFIANVLLMSSFVGMRLRWHAGDSMVTVVRGRERLSGPPGGIVTLLSLDGPATGVATEGLQWELDGEVLEQGSTRGVSNRMIGEAATVAVATGVLLAIQPGTDA